MEVADEQTLNDVHVLPAWQQPQVQARLPAPLPPEPPHRTGGFVQRFGIDIRVAGLTILVDAMAFSGDVISAGLLYPVEIIAAIGLGVITYKLQKAWYGDDHDSALIKALVIGLITAIPVPITGLVSGPAGLVGFINLFRRK